MRLMPPNTSEENITTKKNDDHKQEATQTDPLTKCLLKGNEHPATRRNQFIKFCNPSIEERWQIIVHPKRMMKIQLSRKETEAIKQENRSARAESNLIIKSEYMVTIFSFESLCPCSPLSILHCERVLIKETCPSLHPTCQPQKQNHKSLNNPLIMSWAYYLTC